MSDLTANGVRFNVIELGEGEPYVVFLHGLVMDSLSSWYYTLANPVAREGKALLYDLRGHGLTEQPATGYRLEDALADLRAILDAVGAPAPLYLVGNSYGGLIALTMAMEEPERVAGMVLCEAHFPSEDWGRNTAATLDFAGVGLQDEMNRNLVAEHGKRHHKRRVGRAEAMLRDTSLIADMRACAPLPKAELAKIQTPALALYGSESDIIERGHELAGALPNCELRVLEGGGHTILMHNTRWVREQILQWLHAQWSLTPKMGTGTISSSAG